MHGIHPVCFLIFVTAVWKCLPQRPGSCFWGTAGGSWRRTPECWPPTSCPGPPSPQSAQDKTRVIMQMYSYSIILSIDPSIHPFIPPYLCISLQCTGSLSPSLSSALSSSSARWSTECWSLAGPRCSPEDRASQTFPERQQSECSVSNFRFTLRWQRVRPRYERSSRVPWQPLRVLFLLTCSGGRAHSAALK